MSLLTYDLYRIEMRTRSILIMRGLALSWLVIQILDTIKLHFDFGAYNAPSVLSLSAASLAYVSYLDRTRSEKIAAASSRILALVDGRSGLREILAQVATTVIGQTHFSRVSAYLDGFCIGQADAPHECFVRVLENGYRKDTSEDFEIKVSEGRGTLMAQALQLGEPVLDRGKADRAWFINIPIGKHAAISVSDDRPSAMFAAYESLETVRALMPALRSLDSRLVDLGSRQSHALDRLRSIYGDGRREIEAGCIFADINDYSVYTERYGSCFTDFIGSTYLPALVKQVRKWAVPEFSRGDEVYLVSVEPLLLDAVPIAEATANALFALMDFAAGAGRNLCVDSGFSPVTLAVGVNIGVVTVICDSLKVRTAGQVVNEAKRLQEAAGKGEVLLRASAAERFVDVRFQLSEERPILVKKNLILAHGVRRRLNEAA